MIDAFIEKKKEITDANGNKILELISKDLDYNKDCSVIDSIYVGDGMVMRPDLLSQKFYGTTDEYTKILKFNGISNPFSIDKDQFIVIPDTISLNQNVFVDDTKNETSNIKNQYKVGFSNKKLIRDASVSEYLNRVKQLNAYLPPNVQEEGKDEIHFNENGDIVLGS